MTSRLGDDVTTDPSPPTLHSDQSGATLEKVMAPTTRSTSRRLTTMKLSLVAGLALLISACAEDKPLNTFEPRGPRAEAIDSMMTPIWIIMGVIFVLVVFGTIAIAIKGRVAPEDYDEDDLPVQTHGNFNLEIGWTIAPAILLAVISIPTVQGIWELEETNADPASGECRANADGSRSGELDVMVIGQQWWWEYRYDIDCDGFFEDVDGDGEIYGPNGAGGDIDDTEWDINIALDDDDLVIANQLVIPAGEQIDLELTSRDVIHSFWIPRLNGKRDTVPGRLHTWSLEANDPGEYTGWCTEFCGLSHARMRMSAVALSGPDFDAWLDNQLQLADVPTEADEDVWAGYQLFQANCMSCHVVNDGNLSYGPLVDEDADPLDLEPGTVKDFEAALTAGAAPNLTHFATRTVFAGAIFSHYAGLDADDDIVDPGEYLELSVDDGNPDGDYRLNEAILKRWISNAPDQKAMAPDDLRGMPSFPALSEEDLDHLVAYLATLD